MQSVHTRLKSNWSLETRARQQKQESFRFKSDESYYSSDKSGGAAPLGAKTAIKIVTCAPLSNESYYSSDKSGGGAPLGAKTAI